MNTMNHDRTLSKESTIYNYRLLKRVHHKILHHYAYWLLTVLAWICALLYINPLPFGIVLFGTPLVHAVFLHTFHRTKEGEAPKAWGWSFRMPWFGYTPGNYIALAKVRRLHNQLFWIVLVILACFYPWLSTGVLLFAVFVHVWLLLPRFMVLFMLRKYKAKGFVKINPKDTSCYSQ